MSAHRFLLLSVIRPSVEYGGEVWEGNKGQTNALESVILEGALECSSKTCSEAVGENVELDRLKSRGDKTKLKWWYKLATIPQDRYPEQLFSEEWNVKPHRGRQRKTWGKFLSLGLDKYESLEDIEREDSSLASLMSCVEECISERECKKFEEGLVKLAKYKTFGNKKVLAWSE